MRSRSSGRTRRSSGYGAVPGRPNFGHYVAAYSIDGFDDPEHFKANMDEWLHMMKSTKPAPGHDRVMVAGQPEAEMEVSSLPGLLEEGRFLEGSDTPEIVVGNPSGPGPKPSERDVAPSSKAHSRRRPKRTFSENRFRSWAGSRAD